MKARSIRERRTAGLALWLSALAFVLTSLAPALAAGGHERTPAESGSLTEIPVPASPVVALRVVVLAGSMNDPKGLEGLCNLAMHAAVDGGTGNLTREQVKERLYPMDASVELFVDREVSVFSGRVRREDLKEYFPIFWNSIVHPAYRSDEFQRSRDLSLSSLRNDLRGGNDEWLGKEALQASIYEGTSYGHPALGTESGLEKITLDDVRAFHDAVVRRERVRVGIAGGYDASFVKQVREAMEHLPREEKAGGSTGTLPSVDMSQSPIRPAPIEGLDVLLIDKPARATALSIGFPQDVRRGDPDYWTLFLAMTAFGEHRTFLGRLQREMRMQRGLNYGDYAYLDHFEQDGWSKARRPGMWRSAEYSSIWLRPVQPANGIFALRLAVWELRRLIRDGLTSQEFETTREHLRNLSQIWRQTLSRRLALAMDDVHFGDKDGIESLRRALDGMTVDAVNHACKRRLNGVNLKAVLVCAKADSLRGLIENDTPTPIVYSGGDAPDSLKTLDTGIAAMPLGVKQVRVMEATQTFR